LCADTPVKGQVPAILPFAPIHVHDLWLKGVKDVQPDLDQVGKERLDVPARVLHHELACCLHPAIHACHARSDVPPPQPRPHDQATLLPPVIAKVDAIHGVLQHLVKHREVVLQDPIQQAIHKTRVFNHVHQQRFHAAQGPGPLEHGEPDLTDGESIGVIAEQLL